MTFLPIVAWLIVIIRNFEFLIDIFKLRKE
jgi:hypothetical protein